MARDIICDVCQVNKALYLEGNLETTVQQARCAQCDVAWSLGKLDEILEPAAKAAVAAHWGDTAGRDPAITDEMRALVLGSWMPQDAPGAAETGSDDSQPKSGRRRPGRASQGLTGAAQADPATETQAEAKPEADLPAAQGVEAEAATPDDG